MEDSEIKMEVVRFERFEEKEIEKKIKQANYYISDIEDKYTQIAKKNRLIILNNTVNKEKIKKIINIRNNINLIFE